MKNKKNNNNKTVIIIIIGVVVLIIAGYFVSNGGLFSENKKKIMTPEERVDEYNRLADQLLEPVIVEMAKPVSPYKFVLRSLKEVEKYTWLALDIDTTRSDAWQRLGYINSHIHGKQALLRYESYKNKEMPEKVIEEEKNVILYFSKANLYYDKALEFGTDDSAGVYYLKSEAADIQRLYDYTVINLLDAIKVDPKNRKYKAKLIEAYLNGGRFQNALSQIERYKRAYPDSDVPYLHLAGYYYHIGDTIAAIENYETAIEKGTKPEVGKFLHRYYTQHSEPEKASHFLQKANEAEVSYDPEMY